MHAMLDGLERMDNGWTGRDNGWTGRDNAGLEEKFYKLDGTIATQLRMEDNDVVWDT